MGFLYTDDLLAFVKIC